MLVYIMHIVVMHIKVHVCFQDNVSAHTAARTHQWCRPHVQHSCYQPIYHNRWLSLSPVPSTVWRWSIPLLQCSYRCSLLCRCRWWPSYQLPVPYQWLWQTHESSHLATAGSSNTKKIKFHSVLHGTVFLFPRWSLSAGLPLSREVIPRRRELP